MSSHQNWIIILVLVAIVMSIQGQEPDTPSNVECSQEAFSDYLFTLQQSTANSQDFDTLLQTLYASGSDLQDWMVACGYVDGYPTTPESLKHGQALYQQHCTECHGENGEGVFEVAPALNSPPLFGYNPLKAITLDIEFLIGDIGQLNVEREDLQEELTDTENPPPTERQIEILEQIQAIDLDLEPFLEEQRSQIDARDELLCQLEPAFGRGYLPRITQALNHDRNYVYHDIAQLHGNRLIEVNWQTDDVRTYLFSVIAYGSPSLMWNYPYPDFVMQPWSKLAGGPLSERDIWALVDAIMVWDKRDDWTIDDFLFVEQFPRTTHFDNYDYVAASQYIAVNSVLNDSIFCAFSPSINDVTTIAEHVAELEGDVQRGQALYGGNARSETHSRLRCSQCHLFDSEGPIPIGIWSLILEERLNNPQIDDYTPEEYLIASILYPDSFIVPGWSGGEMPNDYGDRLSLQDIADLVAFMKTLG